MEININPKRVANLLKKLVNSAFAENVAYFEDVNEEEVASLWDMVEAIAMLDAAEEKTICILDDEEAQGCPED